MSVERLDEVGERMIVALPELTKSFEDYCEEWRDDLPGAYNIACDVLMPAASAWLENVATEPLLKRLFSFVEELASDLDQDVRDFAQEGIINALAQNEKWVEAAKLYMGPRTLWMLSRSRTVD